MSIPKKIGHVGGVGTGMGFDVYDIETKAKILSGVSASDVARLLKWKHEEYANKYAANKSKHTSKVDGKKYAIRFAKTITQ
jgi:hypothetical protein